MGFSDQLLETWWVHSHEEDEGDTVVFRPATFAFPPSRGRHGFSLKSDGTAMLTGPDTTDRASSRSGSWHIDAADRLVIDGPGGSKSVFQIASATPDKLVVKRSE